MNLGLSLKRKLILFVVSVVVLAVAGSVGTALYFFAGYVAHESQAGAERGMEGLAALLEDYQKQAMQLGMALAENLAVAAAMEQKDKAVILQTLAVLTRDAGIDFVTVSDYQGIVLARTHEPGKSGDSVKNQTNVRQALAGKPFATVEPGTAVKLSARAGIPVRNQAGTIVGVISVGYDVANNRFVDKIKAVFHTDCTLFLGDERITTTITQNGQRVVGTKLNPAIADIVLNKGQKYIDQADVLGISYLTACMPLIGPDNRPIGVIFAGQPMETANQARNGIFLAVGAFSMIILLLAAIGSFWMAGRISGPLAQVVELVRQVAGGDFTRQVTVVTRDEVGQLADAVNTMILHLRGLVTLPLLSALPARPICWR